MENLNLLFNKLFYEKMNSDQTISDIKEKAQRLIDAEFYENEFTKSPAAEQTFKLKTVYPGFLAGVGYAHGISDENDIKVGFSFDYVTGQPYVPGSSVKGVIRDVFRDPEIVAEILGSSALNIPLPENCDAEKAVKDIEDNIFEGKDVFLDAVIVRGDASGKVMAFDSITHHPDTTKNPTPVKMLKVLPDVIFEFRFKLYDTVITLDSGDEYKISAGKKKDLFSEIIKTFGVGAKTNTGYGNFVDAENGGYSYPAEKTSLPAPRTDGNNRPHGGNQGNNRPQGGNGGQNNNQRHSGDGKKCPSCGKFNYRTHKGTTVETNRWKAKECYYCRGKLFE